MPLPRRHENRRATRVSSFLCDLFLDHLVRTSRYPVESDKYKGVTLYQLGSQTFNLRVDAQSPKGHWTNISPEQLEKLLPRKATYAFLTYPPSGDAEIVAFLIRSDTMAKWAKEAHPTKVGRGRGQWAIHLKELAGGRVEVGWSGSKIKTITSPEDGSCILRVPLTEDYLAALRALTTIPEVAGSQEESADTTPDYGVLNDQPKSGKPLATPKPKRDLLGQAKKLAKVLKSNDMLAANKIVAIKKNIDIPKLEKAIARYRRAIALQTRILDQFEVEVKEIKRDTRTKTPPKLKKRK